MARLIAVVGRKNAGKTTLVVALVRELQRQGRRVMTIKHGHHPADVDQRGTDTWRHFHEAGAERTLIASPEMRVLFERTPDDYDPIGLVQRYMADADIVVAEGFAKAPIPRIEVWRKALGQDPIFQDSQRSTPDAQLAPRASQLVALVSDTRIDAPGPILLFGDTSWLTTLAALAWQHAMEVPA